MYEKALDRLTPPDSSIDPVNHVIKGALMGPSYVFNKTRQMTDEDWADISAYEVSGTGYTSGGVTLTNASKVTSGDLKVNYDSDDLEWGTGTTVTAKGIAFYDYTHADQALISYMLFDENVAATGGSFEIILDADGFLVFEATEAPE